MNHFNINKLTNPNRTATSRSPNISIRKSHTRTVPQTFLSALSQAHTLIDPRKFGIRQFQPRKDGEPSFIRAIQRPISNAPFSIIHQIPLLLNPRPKPFQTLAGRRFLNIAAPKRATEAVRVAVIPRHRRVQLPILLRFRPQQNLPPRFGLVHHHSPD